MFGIGFSELLVIFIVALLVFGPKRLPEVARKLSKGVKDLREAADDARSTILSGMDDSTSKPKPSPPPTPPTPKA